MTINPRTTCGSSIPSAGLKAWYDQRANMLNRHIEEVRKAKGPGRPAAKPAEVKKEEPKPAEAKKEEAKEEVRWRPSSGDDDGRGRVESC